MEEDMLKVLHTTQCMKMIQKVLFSSFYNIDVSIIKIKMFEYWLTVFTGIIARAIIKISMSEVLQKLANKRCKVKLFEFFQNTVDESYHQKNDWKYMSSDKNL